MTSNKEDYLKIIYEEGGLKKMVPNKVLAEKLNISPPSVSEMLSKLSKQNLIKYEPYKGSMLTDKGLESCIDVVRTHRIWEVFLMRHLGYSWRQAHEDAHIIEHNAPARMVDRLDAFLNYPETCPHGSIIPQKGKSPDQIKLLKLTDIPVNGEAVIKRVIEDGELLDYLEQKGIQINKKIKVVAVEEYEGPISFSCEGQKKTISYKAATQILVESE